MNNQLRAFKFPTYTRIPACIIYSTRRSFCPGVILLCILKIYQRYTHFRGRERKGPDNQYASDASGIWLVCLLSNKKTALERADTSHELLGRDGPSLR
jgi:hypothetical protein